MERDRTFSSNEPLVVRGVSPPEQAILSDRTLERNKSKKLMRHGTRTSQQKRVGIAGERPIDKEKTIPWREPARQMRQK